MDPPSSAIIDRSQFPLSGLSIHAAYGLDLGTCYLGIRRPANKGPPILWRRLASFDRGRRLQHEVSRTKSRDRLYGIDSRVEDAVHIMLQDGGMGFVCYSFVFQHQPQTCIFGLFIFSNSHIHNHSQWPPTSRTPTASWSP